MAGAFTLARSVKHLALDPFDHCENIVAACASTLTSITLGFCNEADFDQLMLLVPRLAQLTELTLRPSEHFADKEIEFIKSLPPLEKLSLQFLPFSLLKRHVESYSFQAPLGVLETTIVTDLNLGQLDDPSDQGRSVALADLDGFDTFFADLMECGQAVKSNRVKHWIVGILDAWDCTILASREHWPHAVVAGWAKFEHQMQKQGVKLKANEDPVPDKALKVIHSFRKFDTLAIHVVMLPHLSKIMQGLALQAPLDELQTTVYAEPHPLDDPVPDPELERDFSHFGRLLAELRSCAKPVTSTKVKRWVLDIRDSEFASIFRSRDAWPDDVVKDWDKFEKQMEKQGVELVTGRFHDLVM